MPRETFGTTFGWARKKAHDNRWCYANFKGGPGFPSLLPSPLVSLPFLFSLSLSLSLSLSFSRFLHNTPVQLLIEPRWIYIFRIFPPRAKFFRSFVHAVRAPDVNARRFDSWHASPSFILYVNRTWMEAPRNTAPRRSRERLLCPARATLELEGCCVFTLPRGIFPRLLIIRIYDQCLRVLVQFRGTIRWNCYTSSDT